MKELSEKQLLEEIKEKFEYRDGNLYWREGNGRKSGKLIGGGKSLYKVCSVNRACYYQHRIIFLYHHGYMPKCLDHINNDRHDNRIENLRAVSARQNQHNRLMNKNNTSGVKGVCWHKPAGKWMAQMRCDSKKYYCGLHDNISDAAQAIKDLREKLHGKFANHG
jgi:hypothetical protein